MSLKIYRLCDHSEWAKTCDEWDEAAWPRSPEIAAFFASHYAEAAANKGSELPQTFVAAFDGKPVGMTSLVRDDHPELTHLGPWLAAAFILPEYRGRGIYRHLLEARMEFCRCNGIKELFVYSHLDFVKWGWSIFGETYDPFLPERKVTLYCYDFTTKRN
jgi:GNAT superfamily N-acetyltransferase